MDALVIDLTHGGIKIAISLSKKNIFQNIYCYDIYNTLDTQNRNILDIFNIEICDLADLKNIKNNLLVITPVHLPLTPQEIKDKINNNLISYEFINHHEAVYFILENWQKRCKDIPKIEITGVKGKTSSTFMLKEILDEPLILSSLGAILSNKERDIVLKRNISIAPANIKETIDLAYKIANPICEIARGAIEKTNNVNYKSAIFESSLGVSGVGDVGLLTNIVEDYRIAKGKYTASLAKRQIFRCPIVVCEYEAYNKFYLDITKENINTFSLENQDANLTLNKVDLGLIKTKIEVKYKNLITINNERINGLIEIETFAPTYYHVNNVLGVLGVCLSLEIGGEKIINGFENYKGIDGRSSIKKIDNSIIIEEINPGINATAIKKSIDMIKNLDNYCVVIGGDYGVTCEEIDENKVVDVIDNENIELFLTGAVGKSIKNKIKSNIEFIENYEFCLNRLIETNKNILFIYRSNYKELNKR